MSFEFLCLREEFTSLIKTLANSWPMPELAPVMTAVGIFFQCKQIFASNFKIDAPEVPTYKYTFTARKKRWE